jgi:Asp-tRNA(Asn)/Glu-tRNA(Gln) amidotransferase A subunit family amidase
MALDRIRASQSTLHAFVHVGDDRLLDVARALDNAPQTPLGGLPIGVKDLIDTLDMPTAYGSPIYQNHQPTKDAVIVERIRAAGGVVVGKTATTEFATWTPTEVLNPRNHANTPGGSSAGSATAVAAGLVPIALGTQTLGSIIRPASYCGVVGFKPTFGRLPITGTKPLAPSLDTLGLIGCSVAVVRDVFQALSPMAERGCGPSPRLGFSRGPDWERVAADAQPTITGAVARLRKLGDPVPEVDLTHHLQTITAAVRTVHAFEMRGSLLPEFMKHEDQLSTSLRVAIHAAARLSLSQYDEARQIIAEQAAVVAALFRDFDALLCPAATGEAPPGLSSTGDPIMNSAWTALRGPCITIPTLAGAQGLPIGLQIVGKPEEDLSVLCIADGVERTLRSPNPTRLSQN